MPTSVYQIAAATGPCKPMCEVTVPEDGGAATRRYFVIDSAREVAVDSEGTALRTAASFNHARPATRGQRRTYVVTEAIVNGVRINRHVVIDVDENGNDASVEVTWRLELDSPVVNEADARRLANELGRLVEGDIYRLMPEVPEADATPTPSLPNSNEDEGTARPRDVNRPTF